MVLQSCRSKYAFFVADNNTRNPYGLIDLNQIYDVDVILVSMILARATSIKPRSGLDKLQYRSMLLKD